MLLMSFSTVVYGETTTSEVKEGTILPSTATSEADTLEECRTLMLKSKSVLKTKITDDWDKGGMDVLGCGIRTGQIRLWMVPFYIRYMLEFVIQISGLACVASTVYGGFLYLFAGVSEDKDKGKKAITYGVIGMVITFLAWGIVNIFIMFVTGA